MGRGDTTICGSRPVNCGCVFVLQLAGSHLPEIITMLSFRSRMEDGSTRSFATLQSVYINPAWLTFSIVGEPLTYQADALRCLMLEAIARPVWASTLARNSYSLVAIAAPLTA
jgi:hypothetical protein